MIARGEMIFVFAVALSLSIGWGIRGNFGHETGAMIPGALAALAAVALSRREDWLRKGGSFAFFGALGWSFGGSISYMQVIAYTHSGNSLSILYGFACLFIIGFLWAIFGGLGTALPAFLTRAQLTSLYPLVFVIFAAWFLQDALTNHWIQIDPAFRQRDPLYWYDTDWLGIAVALGATLAYAALCRTFGFGVRLVVWLCAGWWLGFVLFVLILGWRMTPPRGDNWAGCAGMAVALIFFLLRERLPKLLKAALVSGVFGGLGFAGADCLKLLGISSGLATNWHSILEQTYGLINGVGIAAMMLFLRRTLPPAEADDSLPSPAERVAERVAAAFVLVAITYLNLRKNAETWGKAGAVPLEMYGLSAQNWFDLGYIALAAFVLAVMFAPQFSSLRSAPPLAKILAFYLIFLWWMVSGNFERALVQFTPQRLVTEGVIFLNALLCSALILRNGQEKRPISLLPAALSLRSVFTRTVATFATTTLVCWGLVRLIYGDHPIGYASRHIRFGPQATATTAKPAADKPHP